jgi:hypothetical protein
MPIHGIPGGGNFSGGGRGGISDVRSSQSMASWL